MERCSLTLAPYGKPRMSIAMTNAEIKQSQIDRIIEQTDSKKSIYSDLSYEFTIDGIDLSTIEGIYVYINDCYESCSYNNGVIRFPGRGGSDRRIFMDCYGFVEITLNIQLNDGSELNLRSEYLPVLVKKGQLNDSVKAMAQYVYSNQEDLLLNGDPKPKDLASLKEQGSQSLAAQVLLAEEIASVYERNYGYFKANSRFKIEKTASVDHIEKLQYITPATMQYIALHPEQLRQVNSTTGIRINNKVYHPNKTLVVEDRHSYDIYENRIIVGFLRTMIFNIDTLIENTDSILQNIPSDNDPVGEYVYSSLFIFAHTAKMLQECRDRLLIVKQKMAQLWQMYSSIMSVESVEVQYIPKPTALFMSIPQYNKIFVTISQWFSFGIYNFEKESFMLSFIKISSLYESYVLAKLIKHLKHRSFKLEDAKKCHYPVPSHWKYTNTKCKNTFVFTGNNKRITIYYQPVIFDFDSRQVNGIGLYRNNSISINQNNIDERSDKYYTPDYIIKAEINGVERYIILDAKFSTANTVKRYYITDLSFKYLFSISSVEENKSVDGLCIVYGQCYPSNKMQSAYDKQIGSKDISPFADMLPLIEGVNPDDHDAAIQQLLSKIGI